MPNSKEVGTRRFEGLTATGGAQQVSSAGDNNSPSRDLIQNYIYLFVLDQDPKVSCRQIQRVLAQQTLNQPPLQRELQEISGSEDGDSDDLPDMTLENSSKDATEVRSQLGVAIEECMQRYEENMVEDVKIKYESLFSLETSEQVQGDLHSQGPLIQEERYLDRRRVRS